MYISQEEAERQGRHIINLEGELKKSDDNTITFSPVIFPSISAALGKIAKHSPGEVYIRNKPSIGRMYFYTAQKENFTIVYAINTKLLIKRSALKIMKNQPFCYQTNKGKLFSVYFNSHVKWLPEKDLNISILDNTTRMVIWDVNGGEQQLPVFVGDINCIFEIPPDPQKHGHLSLSWNSFDSLKQIAKKKSQTDAGGRIAMGPTLLKFAPGDGVLDLNRANSGHFQAYGQEVVFNSDNYHKLRNSIYSKERHKLDKDALSVVAIIGNYQLSTMFYRKKSKYKKDANVSLNNFVDFTFVRAVENYTRNKVESDPKAKCIVSNYSTLWNEVCDEVYVTSDSCLSLMQTKTAFNSTINEAYEQSSNPNKEYALAAQKEIKEAQPISSFPFNSEMNRGIPYALSNSVSYSNEYRPSNIVFDLKRDRPNYNSGNSQSDNIYVDPKKRIDNNNEGQFNTNRNNFQVQSMPNSNNIKYSSRGGDAMNIRLNERNNGPIQEERGAVEEYLHGDEYANDVLDAYYADENNVYNATKKNPNAKLDSTLNFDNKLNSNQQNFSSKVPFISNLQTISNNYGSNFSVTASQVNKFQPQKEINNFAQNIQSNVQNPQPQISDMNFLQNQFFYNKLKEKNIVLKEDEKIHFKVSTEVRENPFGIPFRAVVDPVNADKEKEKEKDKKGEINPQTNIKNAGSKPKHTGGFLFK